MRRTISRVLWLVFLATTLVAPGCGSGGSESPDGGGEDADGTGGDGSALLTWPNERDLTCSQVKDYLDSSDPRLLALNVSDEEFYDLGSIPGSLRIPWDLLPGRLDEVDPDRYIVIYCRRGVRSEAAYTTLVEATYPNLWVMQGGIERWNELGYPTES